MIRDVSVFSYVMPPEETVLQALNHYMGKTSVYHVHLVKVDIKTQLNSKAELCPSQTLKQLSVADISRE